MPPKGYVMTAPRLSCLTVLAVLLLSHLLPAADQPVIKARVYFETKDQWQQLTATGLDIVKQEVGFIDILTDAEELRDLAGRGFKTDVLRADQTAFLRSRMADKAMGDYKTLDEIYRHLDSLITAYPQIVSPKTSIGQTVEGRDIWAVKISDHPTVDEDEPEVLFTAGIHAREVITPEVLFYFMGYLTDQYGVDPNVTTLVNGRELWFVVMVNPDGYYHNQMINPGGGGLWRKNRRDNGDGSFGVDLNRNFAYQWGYDNYGSSPNPGAEVYRGAGPFSEPETGHLRDFIQSRDFVLSVSYHSYANLILWPWGYDQLYTPDDDIFAQIGDSIHALNGYAPGPAWTLYPVNGGSDDWDYGEQTTKQKTFPLTIEVGSQDDDFWPPASRIAPLVAENLAPNLFLVRIAGDIYSLRAPSAPRLIVNDTVQMTRYTIRWTHGDTLNPAVSFELVEQTGYQAITDPAETFDPWDNRGFLLATDRYASAPTSFFSGAQNKSVHSFQSTDAYAVQPGDTLRFSTWYDIEKDYDYAYVEVAVAGGEFVPIPGTITTSSDLHGNNRGNGITGSSNGDWLTAAFDLSTLAGEKIFIRFSYYTDQVVLGQGIYIDNIYPHVIFSASESVSSITDTTYTMTGKTEGDYYYKVRAIDAQGQWGNYSPAVKVFATRIPVCGDGNGDGQVDLADAVAMVNYVFKGGPAPIPLPMGDATGDGDVNIADVVYLINYVFRGGPAPQC
jgi:murein tripeptide amidase MpaA